MRKSDIGLSDPELRAMNVDLFLAKPLTAETIETLHRLHNERQTKCSEEKGKHAGVVGRSVKL